MRYDGDGSDSPPDGYTEGSCEDEEKAAYQSQEAAVLFHRGSLLGATDTPCRGVGIWSVPGEQARNAPVEESSLKQTPRTTKEPAEKRVARMINSRTAVITAA